MVIDQSTVVYRDATDAEIARAQDDAEATAAVLAAARPKAAKGKAAAATHVDPATGVEY